MHLLAKMNTILSFGERLLDQIQGRQDHSDQYTVTQNLHSAFDAEISSNNTTPAQSSPPIPPDSPSEASTVTAATDTPLEDMAKKKTGAAATKAKKGPPQKQAPPTKPPPPGKSSQQRKGPRSKVLTQSEDDESPPRKYTHGDDYDDDDDYQEDDVGYDGVRNDSDDDEEEDFDDHNLGKTEYYGEEEEEEQDECKRKRVSLGDDDYDSDSNEPEEPTGYVVRQMDPPPVCRSPAAREMNMTELYRAIKESSRNGKVSTKVTRLLGYATRDFSIHEKNFERLSRENEVLKRKVDELNTNWEMLKESKKAKKGKVNPVHAQILKEAANAMRDTVCRAMKFHKKGWERWSVEPGSVCAMMRKFISFPPEMTEAQMEFLWNDLVAKALPRMLTATKNNITQKMRERHNGEVSML